MVEEILIIILTKYINFINMFFHILISKLPKYIRINDYAIKLINGP